VVGGGETSIAPPGRWTAAHADAAAFPIDRGGTVPTYGDSGTYSRFFLIPKAPPSERRLSDGRRSPHPTQKPLALMRHLVRLVTPPGGVILDPFLGSGTTGLAAEQEGFAWMGIERDAEYAAWAEARLNDYTQRGMGLVG
jgi:DNA modification methylase